MLYTKPATGAGTFALPNLHGDITTLVDTAGTITGSGYLYDPFGQPLNADTGSVDLAAVPATRADVSTTDAWQGSAQRGYEHTGGLNQMLMGARTYLPALGIFTATDPIPGGNTTTYTYPQDPINGRDLNGQCWGWGCEAISSWWSGVTSSDAWNSSVDFAKRAWDNPWVRGAVVGLATAALCSTGIGCVLVGAGLALCWSVQLGAKSPQ